MVKTMVRKTITFKPICDILIVSNAINVCLLSCRTTEYTEMVNNLQTAFDRSTKKYFDSNSSDDEHNAEYPDLKTNVFREKHLNTKNVVTPKPALLQELAATKQQKDALDVPIASVAATLPAVVTPTRYDDCDDNDDEEDDDEDVDDVRGDTNDRRHADRSKKRDAEKPTKRRHKDKRRKKRQKTSAISKATVSTDDEQSDIVDASMSTTGDAASTLSKPDETKDESSKKNRQTYPDGDDDDEDTWHYDKPPKHLKKKQKNRQKKSSGTKSSDGGKKSKGSDGASDVKTTDEKSSSKRKQKSSKKKDTVDDSTAAKRPLDPTTIVDNGDHPSVIGSKSKPHKNRTNINDRIDSRDSRQSDGFSNPHSDDNAEDFDAPHKSAGKSSTGKFTKETGSSRHKGNRQASDGTTTSGAKSNKRKADKSPRRPSKKSKITIGHDQQHHSHHNRSRSPSLSSVSSRSMSPPVFTVDLHKKYSQSASNTTPSTKTKEAPPNPSPSIVDKYRPTNADDKDDHRTASPATGRAIKERNAASSPFVAASSPASSFSPEIKNKYDLIKERRSRNMEQDRLNKIVREADKAKKDSKTKESSGGDKKTTKQPETALVSSTTATAPKIHATPEKNHKLTETIEKLKAKNKTSKKQSLLMSEIFGDSPVKESRDERTIYERLSGAAPATTPKSSGEKPEKKSKKKDKLSAATSSNESKVTKPPASSTVTAAAAIVDEYNFVDDLVPIIKEPLPKPSKAPSKAPATAKATKPNSRKATSKKVTAPNNANNATGKGAVTATTAASAPPSAPAAPAAASANKPTNMEALELETEQTLKDINRWLEHTPRFTDFNSRSNSPSRFNLFDDFDGGPEAKLDTELRPPSIPNPVSALTAAIGLDNALSLPLPVPLTPGNIALDEFSAGTTKNTTKVLPTTASSSSVPKTTADSTGASADIKSKTAPQTLAVTIPTAIAAAAQSTLSLLNPVSATVAPKTTQLIGMMPAPGSQKREAKEKKKQQSLKEKLTSTKRSSKDASASAASTATSVVGGSSASVTQQRIDARMQPGKTKGNLLVNVKTAASAAASTTSVGTALLTSTAAGITSGTATIAATADGDADGQSSSAGGTSTKSADGPAQKSTKEVKNSLMQPETSNGPKLSLGSVLDTDGFGLGMQHNFSDEIDKGMSVILSIFVFCIINLTLVFRRRTEQHWCR